MGRGKQLNFEGFLSVLDTAGYRNWVCLSQPCIARPSWSHHRRKGRFRQKVRRIFLPQGEAKASSSILFPLPDPWGLSNYLSCKQVVRSCEEFVYKLLSSVSFVQATCPTECIHESCLSGLSQCNFVLQRRHFWLSGLEGRGVLLAFSGQRLGPGVLETCYKAQNSSPYQRTIQLRVSRLRNPPLPDFGKKKMILGCLLRAILNEGRQTRRRT